MAEHKDESLLTKSSGELLDHILDFVGRKINVPLTVRYRDLEYQITIDGDTFHIISYTVGYFNNVILFGQVIRDPNPTLLTDMYLRGLNPNVVVEFLCGDLKTVIRESGRDWSGRYIMEQIVLEYDKAHRVNVDLYNFEQDLSCFIQNKIRPVLQHMMSLLGLVVTNKRKR